MKKQFFTLVLALVVTLTFSAGAFAADTAKIGVVSFEKIMRESSAGKMGQEELKKASQSLKAKLEAEKKNLEEIQKGFEREFLVLSPEKKKEKEREFRISVNDFNKMQKDFATELKNKEIALLNKMQRAVFLIAKEIGDKRGFTLIIEKKNAGVIYMSENVDITDEVVKAYNAQVAKK